MSDIGDIMIQDFAQVDHWVERIQYEDDDLASVLSSVRTYEAPDDLRRLLIAALRRAARPRVSADRRPADLIIRSFNHGNMPVWIEPVGPDTYKIFTFDIEAMACMVELYCAGMFFVLTASNDTLYLKIQADPELQDSKP